MKIFCSHAGCSNIALDGCRVCEKHGGKTAMPDGVSKKKLSAHKRGYGIVWRRLRKMVLAEEPFCKVCETNPSEEVDHILPKFKGGTNERENLQGICKECHLKKTIEDAGKAPRCHDNIRIVTGAPFSGKRSYVYPQVHERDIVFDWDKIMKATQPSMSGKGDISLGMALRDSFMAHAKKLNENRRAWIMLTDFAAANDMCDVTKGTLVVVDRGQDVALNAAHKDGNRVLEAVINSWYANYNAYVRRYGEREGQINIGELING